MASSYSLQIDAKTESRIDRLGHRRSITLAYLAVALLIGEYLLVYGTEVGTIGHWLNSFCFPAFPPSLRV